VKDNRQLNVLFDDLFIVGKEKIKDLEIVRTVVRGTTVYQA
jgi:predicted amidohydrolase YtcJ